MLRSLNLLCRRHKIITQELADSRSTLISDLNYSFYLTLHRGSKYDGLARISFATPLPPTPPPVPPIPTPYPITFLTPTPPPVSTPPEPSLQIDFQGKEVSHIAINSTALDKSHFSRESIQIPLKLLQTNNVVEVRYSCEYDKDGSGCVSFIDVDGEQYLYTQFQPAFASRVFPLFDQPDLKGKMQLQIACAWGTVLSNELQNQQHTTPSQWKYPEDYKVISFKQTKSLSSYLYSFVVGPYKVYNCTKSNITYTKQLSSQIQAIYSRVPMRLYCISSLYNQLLRLAPMIEQMTVLSLIFFERYFKTIYPFSKYDQVFAHQYKWGAMQNAGLVTLNDAYLFKDAVSTERLLSFCNTIVHELSHHWFGNLVTMKWWDDLWLNESFAEYISHYCLEKIKSQVTTLKYESAMLSFYSRKQWGYAEDQLITTHPIRSVIRDTAMAESIFDGITYSKGAATLKQLMYLMGQPSFGEALAKYFLKYQYRNAVLDDLVHEMGEYAAKWKQQWLQSAGTNTIKVQWKNANANSIRIKQGFVREQYSTYRTHKIRVAFITKQTIEVEQIVVKPEQYTEVPIKINKNNILAVVPNYDDLTFAKILLDDDSKGYFLKNLSKSKCDTLTRAIVWHSYFQMVKYCQVTCQEYCDFVLQNINNEMSDTIFQQQLSLLLTVINRYAPVKKQLFKKSYFHFKEYLLRLNEGNRKVILKEKIIDFAEQNKHQLYEQYICGNLSNTLRWKIVFKLMGWSQISHEKQMGLLKDITERDVSDEGINKANLCKGKMADQEQYKAYYQMLFCEGKSVNYFMYLMRGLNCSEHRRKIKKTYFQKYFDIVREECTEENEKQQIIDNKEKKPKNVGKQKNDKIDNKKSIFKKGDYFENYLVHMDPALEENVEDLETKIQQFKRIKVKNNAKIQRIIIKKIDMLERRVKVYRYNQKK